MFHTDGRDFALSDAITVFKDGALRLHLDDMPSVSHDALVQAMVGRNLGDIYGWKPRPMARSGCAWRRSKRRAVHAG